MQDIRTARQALSVTQIELARLLGLHQSTISRMESGSLPVDERTSLAIEALIARSELPPLAAAPAQADAA